MPAAKNSDVVEHARRLWLTLPHEERAVRKLAVRLREQGIKVGKSTIAEWVRKWDQEHAVAQTLPDELVSAIANGQSLAAVEQSLAVAAAEVTRRLRAGGDIKVLTRCVAVCAVAYRDLAEGARHRVETDLLVERNRAERARDVTSPANAGEDSDPAALAVYAELERIEMEIQKKGVCRDNRERACRCRRKIGEAGQMNPIPTILLTPKELAHRRSFDHDLRRPRPARPHPSRHG